MSAFEKYSPFIRDYIYSRNWDSLREVQIGAAEVLFGTENNLRAAFYTHAFAHRCSCLYKLNNCKRTNFPQLDKFS